MNAENQYKDLEQAIENTKTKYCLPILKFLYKYPNSRQIDIANGLNISPGNLTGILRKLFRVRPHLIIEMNISGQGKCYCLPPEIKKYLDSLDKNPISLTEQDPLGKWIAYTGKADWKSLLSDTIKNGTQSLVAVQKNAFSDLLYSIRHNGVEQYKEILGPDLTYEISGYIDKAFENDASLYKIYQKNWISAFYLVDYIFSHLIYDTLEEDYKIYKSFDLTSDEYQEIKKTLLQMVCSCIHFINYKTEIYEQLSKELEENDRNNVLVFYIAEKIHSRRDIIKERINEIQNFL